jgi:hypothetical protein
MVYNRHASGLCKKNCGDQLGNGAAAEMLVLGEKF